MALNIPDSPQERIVILGAGFAGLTLARKLVKSDFQIVLIDRNNFHQFQPLFYQIAMAGLEPSSISFPIRKIFQRNENIFIRMAEFERVLPEAKMIRTSNGDLQYNQLVIATGVETNFYGNQEIAKHSFTLKSVSDAVYLRNAILDDYENALITEDYTERQPYIDIVIVGGGPTGVELAGSLAEMKKYILPKDYREINVVEVDVYLIQSSDRLLKSMSKKASEKAKRFLESLGVKVKLNQRVTSFKDQVVYTNQGEKIPCRKMIWAAGITAQKIKGLNEQVFVQGNRIAVDRNTQVIGHEHIFALGDIARMQTANYQGGHPQVAQGAIQHAKHLAKFLKRKQQGKSIKSFKYRDLGSLATVGRNKAVADLPGFKTQGFMAWVLWLLVHLKSILGVRNKVIVLINWVWNYLTYDQALRLIIRHKVKKK
jgi:NADH dehydrogenase